MGAQSLSHSTTRKVLSLVNFCRRHEVYVQVNFFFFFFGLWISNDTSIFFIKDYSSSSELLTYHFQKLVEHICGDISEFYIVFS